MPSQKAKKILKNKYRDAKQFCLSDIIKALICFVLGAVVFTGIVFRYIKTSAEDRRLRVSFFAASYSNEMQRTLDHTLSLAYTIEALIHLKKADSANFHEAAERLIEHYPSVLNVQFAPNGVITQAEPLEGNEKAIGLNMFDYDGHKTEVLAAKESGKMILAGPYQLVQGYIGLIGMLPVFTENDGEKEFWGFINIIINPKSVVDNLRSSGLSEKGYKYELLKSSGTSEFRFTVAKTKTPVKNPVERGFKIANTEWIFRLEPAAGWVNVKNVMQISIVLALLDVLIFVSALLIQNFVSYNKRLENAISFDSLTGAYTRQAGILLLEHEIRKAKRNNTKIMLCFIDMNNFKHINDTYGHSTGDFLLQKAVEYMKNAIRATDVISRFGGDEFLVILSDQHNPQTNEYVIKRLTKALSATAISETNTLIEFSASIGTAIYPDNGQDCCELIEYADKKMYIAKQARKNGLCNSVVCTSID